MNKRKYTLGEEIFNSTSHGIGLLLSIAAMAVMIVEAAGKDGLLGILASVIFGSTLMLLYAASTLYHALTHEKAKKVFQILDHCSIYLLIAGSYTPFALLTIGGTAGWVIFGIIWAAALVGILLNSINLQKFRVFSVILYVAMGWAIIFYLPALLKSLPTGGLALLASGGLLYTLGIVFYAVRKVPYFHSVWHLFVLGGSITHILSVALFVL